MVVAGKSETALYAAAYVRARRQRLDKSPVPDQLVKRHDPRRNHAHTLGFVKRIAADDWLPDGRRSFPHPQHEIQKSLAAGTNQPIDLLSAGNRDLIGIVGELDLGLAVESHQLVNTAESRLAFACYEVSADAEDIDLVPLGTERPESLFIDVVGSADGKPGEYRTLTEIDLVGTAEELTRFP